MGQQMPIVTYGHYGFPLLLFPTAMADYLEYERFLLIEAIAPWIEAGKVKVFSVDSINGQAWLNRKIHPYQQGVLQARYNEYITREVVPYIWHSVQGRMGVITTGASLGAYHAANQLFRRPDLFDGCVAMSGCYNLREYTYADGYGDDNLFFNNVVEYLPGLGGEPLRLLQGKRHIHLLSGQGAYENPGASQHLAWLLHTKGIPFELDLWGRDCRHDWPTWRSMLPHYLETRF